MKRLFQFIIIFYLASCHHPESDKYDRHKSANPSPIYTDETTAGYKVIGIKDGDTFVLLIEGKEETVRLAHIDCPEKKQPYGSRARQFASDLCFGKYVILVHNDKYDRYKRLIAEILLPDGTNVNKELVKNGLAWHFKKYSDNTEYAQLETEARSKRIGIWSEPNAIAPWTWRKNKK